MRKLREAVQTVIRLVRGGVFAGSHKPLRYDPHTLATTGNDAIQRMEAAEDRYDVMMSARADREAEIAYWSSR